MRRLFFFLVVVIALAFVGYSIHRGGYDYLERKTYRIVGIIFDPLITRPDKMWLHMVNSPEKVIELQSRYYGLEMDVVFHDKEGKFENSHDKESLTLHPLEATLEKVDTNQVHGLWIDFKNLTASNKDAALKELNRLISEKKLNPSQVIVESPNWQNLGGFHSAGYRTSFYLPKYTPDQLAKEGLIENQIKEAVDSGNIDYVSFGAVYYPEIEKLCDGKDFKMLTWMTPVDWSYSVLSKKTKPIINDPRVDVILVEQFGKHHR